MLVATSLIYALIYGTNSISVAVVWSAGPRLRENRYEIYYVFVTMHGVTYILLNFVFAYNFYVYLITGKRFRSGLRDFFRRCLPSSSSPPPAAPAAIAMVAGGNDV